MVMKYFSPQVTRGLERSWKQGKDSTMLASDEIAWKDRNCRAWVSLSFALTRLRVVRLLSKADLCFLLQSLLGACARPPAQAGSPKGPGGHHWAWLDLEEGKMKQ